MSNFFSNLFSGNKKKPTIESNENASYYSEQKFDENNVPEPMARRFSLSKSGRMKEKKRMKVNISEHFEASQDGKRTELENGKVVMPK